MSNDLLLSIVYILLAILLFAMILSIGFKTSLKDFLKSQTTRRILSIIILVTSVLVCIGCALGAVSSKQEYESNIRLCKTKIFEENRVIIGHKEIITGVDAPIYDDSLAKTERDECINTNNNALAQKLCLFGVILVIGIGGITFGVLVLRKKILVSKRINNHDK